MAKACRFEDVLRPVGGGPRWHWAVFLVSAIPCFFAGLHNVGSVLLLYTPDHWCSVAPADSHLLRSAARNNWTSALVKEYSVPRTGPTGSFSKCELYVRNYTAAFSLTPAEVMRDTANWTASVGVRKCSQWTYDTSQMSSTVVTQWNLVCDYTAYASIGKSAYMFGMFFGSAGFGYLSDRFGRRRIALLCLIQYQGSALLAAFAPYYVLYVTLRMLTGMAAIGTYMCCFVIMSEMVMPKQRGVLQTILNLFFSFGIMTLPAVAAVSNNWNTFYLIITVSSLSMCSFYWILPESPRWLILQGRKTEALRVLRMVAIVNGRRHTITDDKLMKLIDRCHEHLVKSQDFNRSDKSPSLFHLFRTPEMRKNTIICCYLWASVSCAYYGITYASPSLGANLKSMVLLVGLSDLSSGLIGTLFIKLASRKANIFGNLLVTSVLCLLYGMAVEPGHGWMESVVIMLARATVGVAFIFLYLVTAELFPTDHRNIALGVNSTMGRIGATSSAFIIDFLSVSYAMILLGVLMMLASGLCLLVHETGNTTLPETKTDVEHFDDLEIKEGEEREGEEDERDELELKLGLGNGEKVPC